MSRTSATDEPGDADALLEDAGLSLLDLVDNLLNRGVVVTGDVVLGLADVDLVYLRLSLLLCAADRALPQRRATEQERLYEDGKGEAPGQGRTSP